MVVKSNTTAEEQSYSVHNCSGVVTCPTSGFEGQISLQQHVGAQGWVGNLDDRQRLEAGHNCIDWCRSVSAAAVAVAVGGSHNSVERTSVASGCWEDTGSCCYSGRSSAMIDAAAVEEVER